MDIVITHCRYAPRWETLETMIREATNEADGRLVRIKRKDNGVDYRAIGVYRLDFRQNNKTILPITLRVVGVGE